MRASLQRYSSAESPTSENAATGADQEDLPTKALNQGTKDVDDGNVGRTEDPRTSSEALAKGTSAECANGTLVLLTGEPHETQNEPQNSLPLTPRPPIEGEPNACKQEATDGIMMAERTKGMAQSANPPETDTDVDRTALLGGEPAERARGVGEGDETERDSESQPQQTRFYCEESHQRNKNANRNVPSIHGVPLVGEWTGCASGKDQNSRADRPSESKEAEDTAGVESECCERGTSEGACIDETDGDPGRELERVDAQNELAQLLTTTIAPYVDDSDTNTCVHLRCVNWRTGSANSPGRETDVSNGQTDASRGLTDVLRTSDRAGTADISDGEGAETYLGVRDAKRVVNVTDGIGSHADMSSGHWDMQNVEADVVTTANTSDIVSIP